MTLGYPQAHVCVTPHPINFVYDLLHAQNNSENVGSFIYHLSPLQISHGAALQRKCVYLLHLVYSDFTFYIPSSERPWKKNHMFFEDTEQTKLQGPVTHLLLLNKRYNSCRVLAFSSIFFHSLRSWACSDHLRSFILLRSFLTSSSHYV